MEDFTLIGVTDLFCPSVCGWWHSRHKLQLRTASHRGGMGSIPGQSMCDM